MRVSLNYHPYGIFNHTNLNYCNNAMFVACYNACIIQCTCYIMTLLCTSYRFRTLLIANFAFICHLFDSLSCFKNSTIYNLIFLNYNTAQKYPPGGQSNDQMYSFGPFVSINASCALHFHLLDH